MAAELILAADTETAGGWCERIRARWQDTVAAIFEVGQMLTQAKLEVGHGAWGFMFSAENPNRLPFGQNTANKIMAVARNTVLANSEHVKNLPPSWGTLYELSRIPEPELIEAFESGAIRPDMERQHVKQMLRNTERSQRDSTLQQPEIPKDRYALIYADPPWRYEHSKTVSREIENQYPTMSLDEICELPVGDIAADDCTLFLWTTSPKLAESLEVVNAWGFIYRTCAVWDKDRIGMGYYFRQQHELLLVATKGSPPAPEPANRLPSVFRIKRSEIHSAKPPQVAEAIEAMYPGLHSPEHKIELFCRTPRAGWAIWGNQARACA